jgi:uncharacterized membrane protein YukC
LWNKVGFDFKRYFYQQEHFTQHKRHSVQRYSTFGLIMISVALLLLC